MRAVAGCVRLRHGERRVVGSDGEWREGGERRATGVVLGPHELEGAAVQLQAREEMALPQSCERAQLHRGHPVLAQQCHPRGGGPGRSLVGRSRADLAALAALAAAASPAVAAAAPVEHLIRVRVRLGLETLNPNPSPVTLA